MEFEKHAFGIGVITGLFLSCLDIQLSHYLQSLLWPECPKMIEQNANEIVAALNSIVVALNNVAEPNWAEKRLVLISGIAAALTLIAICITSYQAFKTWQQAQKNLNLESDRIKLEMLKRLYSTAFNKLKISDSHAPKNDAMSWNNSAKFLLNAELISAQFLTPEYKDIQKIEQSLWQIQFQNLLEFDQSHIKLDAQFFFGSPDFPSVKHLTQTKIETEKNKGLNLDTSAVAVIYLLAYKSDYLSDFVEAKKKELNTEGIWEAFDKIPFHIPETWDSAFDKNGVIDIRETGAYQYVKKRLTTSIDLHEEKDKKGIDNKDYLSSETQLKHDLSRMRFKFTNWTMQNPLSDKEELVDGPNYAYYLVIEPIDLLLVPNNTYFTFSFQAEIKTIYKKYWHIKSVHGGVSLYMERRDATVKCVGNEFTVYVNQFELHNKNFEVIEARFSYS